ncbi:MAG TPA: hypothetical protein VH373_07885 [Jatrophihabitantaceae bacterium]|jgi:hypothetical protein
MTGQRETADREEAVGVYLHVMPHHDGGTPAGRWHVFQVSDTSPRITVAASVGSWDEARTLGTRAKRPLRVSELAWRQMADAGVAPQDVPDDVTIV